jgi:hypothetical protein
MEFFMSLCYRGPCQIKWEAVCNFRGGAEENFTAFWWGLLGAIFQFFPNAYQIVTQVMSNVISEEKCSRFFAKEPT